MSNDLFGYNMTLLSLKVFSGKLNNFMMNNVKSLKLSEKNRVGFWGISEIPKSQLFHHNIKGKKFDANLGFVVSLGNSQFSCLMDLTYNFKGISITNQYMLSFSINKHSIIHVRCYQIFEDKSCRFISSGSISGSTTINDLLKQFKNESSVQAKRYLLDHSTYYDMLSYVGLIKKSNAINKQYFDARLFVQNVFNDVSIVPQSDKYSLTISKSNGELSVVMSFNAGYGDVPLFVTITGSIDLSKKINSFIITHNVFPEINVVITDGIKPDNRLYLICYSITSNLKALPYQVIESFSKC